MALQPISASINRDLLQRPDLANPNRNTPPGRPSQPRELMPVPGQPRALENRPDQAPGRIPVPSETDPTDMIKGVEEAKKNSVAYQIINRLFGKKGDDDKSEAPRLREPQRPAEANTGDRPAQRQTTVEEYVRLESESVEIRVDGDETVISLNRLTYERVVQRREPDPLPVQKTDPLALDLNGNGLETTGVAQGVNFDINGDGQMDRTSFVTGGDAFLALDRNGNGTIDNGTELFGDQNGDANGFAALARYDDNGDGRIDTSDAVYANLRLLSIDAQGEQQLSGLKENGITAINLSYRSTDTALNQYDTVAQIGGFEREDGSTGTAGDLMLGYSQDA